MSSTSTANNVEARKIRLHPGMVFDIISKQSGTIEKAFAELVTNAVDAGATACHIRINETGFSVSDDGKGFTERQEIEDFFETFGTPHIEGDARFGRHRIGRGQIMAFASTKWRSGPFSMDVDVRGRGDDYVLTHHEDRHRGCLIEGTFYRGLQRVAIQQLARALSDLILYIDIPVFVQGSRVTTALDSLKWDEVTEDAYYRFTPYGGLKFYNMGMYVETKPANQFGTHGVVVTRKSLKLNWARNDILWDCTVKESITSFLRKRFDTRLSARDDLTIDEKETIWKLVSAQEISPAILFEKPLFKLSNGVFKTAAQLKPRIAFSEDGDPVGDRIIEQGLASVLSPWNATQAGGREWLLEIFDWFSRPPELCEISELTDYLVVDYKVLKPRVLSPEQKAVLTATQKANAKLLREVNLEVTKHWGLDESGINLPKPSTNTSIPEEYGHFGNRKIVAGDSGGLVEAWTDGLTYIAIDKRVLDRSYTRGPACAQEILALLLHEYTHRAASSITHIHGPEFHEKFHEASIRFGRCIGEAARVLQYQLTSQCIDKGVKLPTKLSSHLWDSARLLSWLHRKSKKFDPKGTVLVLGQELATLALVLRARFFWSEATSVDNKNSLTLLRLAEQNHYQESDFSKSLEPGLREWRASLGEIEADHPDDVRREVTIRVELDKFWAFLADIGYDFSFTFKAEMDRLRAGENEEFKIQVNGVRLIMGTSRISFSLPLSNLFSFALKSKPDFILSTYHLFGCPYFSDDCLNIDVATSSIIPPWERNPQSVLWRQQDRLTSAKIFSSPVSKVIPKLVELSEARTKAKSGPSTGG